MDTITMMIFDEVTKALTENRYEDATKIIKENPSVVPVILVDLMLKMNDFKISESNGVIFSKSYVDSINAKSQEESETTIVEDVEVSGDDLVDESEVTE